MSYFFVHQSFNDIQCLSFAKLRLAAIVAGHVYGSLGGWSGGEISFRDSPDSPSRQLTDALGYLQAMIVVSERARHALACVVGPRDVEWIASLYRGCRYWIMHGLVILDAIDEEASDIVRIGQQRCVMKLRSLSVLGDRCRGHSIFRLNNGLESWGYVVSSDFVEAWQEAGLTGLNFSPVGVKDG
jgi:hypothetical protein